MKKKQISRRRFIRTATAASGGLGLLTFGCKPRESSIETPKIATERGVIPPRTLGKTDCLVGQFGLGGQGLLEQPDRADEALAIINRAIDLGVNYLDTAHYYGKGCSEEYYGRVMRSRRKEVYLATKTAARDYDGAMRELEMSLKRLQTDHLDCWQMHNVRTEKDLEAIFASSGVLKAFVKAREEKITRFIGITGHRDPFVLKKAIERHPFDTILMALNAADKNLPGEKHEHSFIDNLLPVAVEKKMGIIGMKVPAMGRIFNPMGITTMEQAMSYVLTLPVSTIVVGIKAITELEENVRIARDFASLKPEEMAKLEALTKPYFGDATFFKREKGY